MAEALGKRNKAEGAQNGQLDHAVSPKREALNAADNAIQHDGSIDDEADPKDQAGRPSVAKEAQSPSTQDQDEDNEVDDGDDDEDDEDVDEDDDDDEEDEEDEPTLKYAKLTATLASIYRNGDSTSAFLVSGDKMLVGTHNGNVHVLSIPTFKTLRYYHAHSTSITAISVCPYTPAFTQPHAPSHRPTTAVSSSVATITSSPTPRPSPNTRTSTNTPPRRPQVPATPSNSIYIATASMDGHVFISSLVDSKDVIVRNFSRPVHAVALSPAFKSDRTYLSGGTAGNLILTVGGKTGVIEDANPNSAAAAAAGWLNTIGLASASGRDTILHGGEGTITSIKWSPSGKYVVWNNEYGTRVMRSHLHHTRSDTDLVWKRLPMGHVPAPNTGIWEQMAGVWRARVEWIDEAFLENDDRPASDSNSQTKSRKEKNSSPKLARSKTKTVERVIVGWGDRIWLLHIHDELSNSSNQVVTPARVENPRRLKFQDGVVSGLALYTPSILVVLLYREAENAQNDHTPTKGAPKRQTGLPPDLRLIDIDATQMEELESESLLVNRYQSLSASDYHLSRLFVLSAPSEPVSTQRGALETIGGGLRDVGMNATRLFGSSASIMSGSSGGDRPSTAASVSTLTQDRSSLQAATSNEPLPALTKPGLKIFIQSPFDCWIALKRDAADRLSWLLEHQKFEEAWTLVSEHPDIVSSFQVDSRLPSPAQSVQSLGGFFNDETPSQSISGATETNKLAAEREKQRIGNLWIQQLVDADAWTDAGAVAGKVLGDSPKWSDWIMAFAQAGKFDEITPQVPTEPLRPPLPAEVYEIILGHYITHDKQRLQSLIEQWDSDMFDVPTIILAISDKLNTGTTEPSAVERGVHSQDERILVEVLAKLFMVDNQPDEAIRCYVRIRSPDDVFELIRDYNVINAIDEIIFTFILIRITPVQQKSTASLLELDKLSSEPILLLASAASQGIISPDKVVSQLNRHYNQAKPFLFFYFRALWNGEALEDSQNEGAPSAQALSRRRLRFATPEITSRPLMIPHADLVVSLFAEYRVKPEDTHLLYNFLESNQDYYDLSRASQECRTHQRYPELVYLLRITGRTTEALHLIIDEMEDVAQAVRFAKEIDERSLWDNLVDYSMDKPSFIRGLLEDAGTSIDPVALVRRIPPGQNVPGLKTSLAKVLKEREATWSIALTASKVLSGEVGQVLQNLREGRERGQTFEPLSRARSKARRDKSLPSSALNRKQKQCSLCQRAFSSPSAAPNDEEVQESEEHLVGFSCGDLFHLTCILDCLTTSSNKTAIADLQRNLAADMNENPSSHEVPGRLGTKIRHAHMIQEAVGEIHCPACTEQTRLDGNTDA